MDIIESLRQVSAELVNATLKPDTLLFVYSGHHAAETKLKPNDRDVLASKIQEFLEQARHDEDLSLQDSLSKIQKEIEKFETDKNNSTYVSELLSNIRHVLGKAAEDSKTFFDEIKNILKGLIGFATNSQVDSREGVMVLNEKNDKQISQDLFDFLNAVIVKFEKNKECRFEKAFTEILATCKGDNQQTSDDLLTAITDQINEAEIKQPFSSQEIFHAMKDIIHEVNKIIIVLDCCYAETPCLCEQAFKGLKLKNKTVIHLNGGTNRQRTLADLKHGSTFVQTFVQAMESKKVDCILQKLGIKSAEKSCARCEKWWNDNKEVVMLSRLLKYLEEHVCTHGLEIGEEITPKLSMINCSSYDEIIAFKTQITYDISCELPDRLVFKSVNIPTESSYSPVVPSGKARNEFLFSHYTGNIFFYCLTICFRQQVVLHL